VSFTVNGADGFTAIHDGPGFDHVQAEAIGDPLADVGVVVTVDVDVGKLDRCRDNRLDALPAWSTEFIILSLAVPLAGPYNRNTKTAMKS